MCAQQNTIKINQALHGYSKGHCLLEVSMKLPRETERLLLLMSDMSGQSMVKGFESYITGYPLDDSGYYAFAKTWYAPEMNRPGCVWTHTLLINKADFAATTDLRSLLNLFARPSDQESWNRYKTQLSLSAVPSNFRYNQRQNSFNDAYHILLALYSKPEMPIYIPSDSALKYEDIIMLIWNQQWPHLRDSFSFCTGSISNRKFNGKFIDVQVIPLVSIRQFKRGVQSGYFLNDTEMQPEVFWNSVDKKGTPNKPLWISLAMDDFIENNRESKLRQFLWEYGAGGRSAFSNFVDIFNCIENVNSGSLSLLRLIKAVRKSFPFTGDGEKLKAALFGVQNNRQHRFLSNIEESDLLLELLTTQYHSAFDPNTLGIYKRAKSFCGSSNRNLNDLILRLFDSKLNPLGEEFLRGASEDMDSAQAINLSVQKPGLLNILVNMNPDLAASDELWRRSANTNIGNDFFDSIANSSNITPDTVKAIVKAMLRAKNDTFAEYVVNQFEDNAVIAIFEWLNTSYNSSSIDVGINWRNALKKHTPLLLKWIEKPSKVSSPVMVLLTNILNPNSRQVLAVGAKTWLNLAKSIQVTLDRDKLYETMAFLLAIGFNNPGDGADELVSFSFEVVHDAVESNKLKYHSWQLLNDQVPLLHWWKEWDKCEKLRRALVKKFIKNEWSVEHFLLSAKREKTFRRIIESCENVSSGKKFIKRVAKQVAQGDISATIEQRAMLDKLK